MKKKRAPIITGLKVRKDSHTGEVFSIPYARGAQFVERPNKEQDAIERAGYPA